MPDRESSVTRAISYLKSLQPKVDRVARFVWTPTAEAVTGVKAPPDPSVEEREAKAQELQRQIDAYKLVQERAHIQSLRDRLTSGN